MSENLSILVVEDNPADAAFIRETLPETGTVCFHVESVSRLSQALSRLERKGLDLVLADLGLPDSQGLQTFHKLRQAAPDLPVIVFTGSDDQELAVAAVRDGAQDYFIKGQVGGSLLARAARYAVERHRAEAEIHRLNAELERRVLDRTAELHAANEELGSFSYSVSHDLRAPLRAVIGYASILREEHAAQLDSEGLRILAIIGSEGARMGRLIDNLLAFSRLGRQPLRRSPIDMEDLARTVFAELAKSEPGRTLRLSLAPLPPARGDPSMLRQVWVNLLSNAIKYTSTREVAQIRIGSRTEDGEITYLVQDNGVGFEMRYAGRLFGVFQRLHSEAEFAGTGVGLALVQRTLHRHGGRVWVDARIDAGATFFFTLPPAGNA